MDCRNKQIKRIAELRARLKEAQVHPLLAAKVAIEVKRGSKDKSLV